jgi:hypothetical protein
LAVAVQVVLPQTPKAVMVRTLYLEVSLQLLEAAVLLPFNLQQELVVLVVVVLVKLLVDKQAMVRQELLDKVFAAVIVLLTAS